MNDASMTEPRPFSERFSLRHRVVLLTGAAGGIGSVFAWALAEAGAIVAATDRSLELLAPLEDRLARFSASASMHAADLASVDACRSLVDEVHARHGHIDVLVNDAAVMARGPIAEMEQEDFDRVIAVNIRAPYFLAQAVQKGMRERGGGSIINIGSINSAYGLDTVSIYGLTKGAITQFTQVAAAEWAADGIRVNCIAPGFMKTPFNAEALWANEARRAWIIDRVPLARPGVADDLVGTLLFLASDASAFMTGETLFVDGGFRAGGSWDRQGPSTWPRDGG